MKYLLVFILTLSTCWSEESKAPKLTPKEAALEKIFSDLSPEELPQAIETARKAGVHQQALLEARFLNLVDQKNFHAIAQLTPELIKQRDQFNLNDSEIFAVQEDWLSIVHYAQALDALEKNDQASFKKHITEAFWLSPRQGQAFAPHINNLRMKNMMAAITLQPTHPMHPQDGSATTTLGALMKDKKGAILYFWSPMSQEVYQHLQNFIQISQLCKKNQIAVISILVGYNDQILADAKLWCKEDALDAASSWMIDPKIDPLSNTLRVMNIPTMVIVSPKGKIIFNGHPTKDSFWKQLQQLNPSIKRPAQLAPHKGHAHADG